MKTRKDKKRDKERRQQDYRQRRWQQYARILDAIGLGDGFRMLKERTKTLLCSFGLPLPEIIADPSDPATQQVKKEIFQELEEAQVDVGETKLPFLEVYRILTPLVTVLQDATIDTDLSSHPDVRFLRRARTVCTEQYDGIIDSMLQVLANAVAHAVARSSEFDLRILWFRVEKPILEGVNRRSHRIKIEAEPCQRIEVMLDGSVRAVYRCGGDVREGFQWVNWSAKLFDGRDGQDYPVYIQKHALDRLHDRLRPFSHASVHLSLRMSLNHPVITPCKQDSTYLVEYRLAGRVRVGYLVARRLSDKIVITTFLFLTMQGTPEAQRLAQHLRLRRPDIEYNRLDRLSEFINTDLSKDRDLAHVFEESGCRDLLRLYCNESPASSLQAAVLRQYLGLTPPNKRIAECPRDILRINLIGLNHHPEHLTDQSPACHPPLMFSPEISRFPG